MKILFFGDICGKIGRKAFKKVLPGFVKKYQPDFIFANGENLAHGVGVTARVADDILSLGVDFLTSGNHFFAKKDDVDVMIEEKTKVIRPENYPGGFAGKGYVLLEKNGQQILLINLLGRVFIENGKNILNDPFNKAKEILINYPQVKVKIVDFHAEATSEKQALGYFLDGQISALVGTHTHIPTADARILPKGTAYITDLGMVGARDSVIGISIESSIDYMTGKEKKLKADIPEVGPTIAQGVFLDIDETSGLAKQIERIEAQAEIS